MISLDPLANGCMVFHLKKNITVLSCILFKKIKKKRDFVLKEEAGFPFGSRLVAGSGEVVVEYSMHRPLKFCFSDVCRHRSTSSF